MEKEIEIFKAGYEKGKGLRLFLKNPVYLILTMFVLSLVFSFVFLSLKQIHDRYYPFEGKVISIGKKWYDSIVFESDDDEHLTILTAEGKTIDRYIDTFERVRNRIAAGDTVVKRKGFSEPVRAVGKKSADELIEEMKNKTEDQLK
jgi:DNA-binding protein